MLTLLLASTVSASSAGPTPAGSYFGSLPLSGCADADALLQVQRDGTYLLQTHCVADMQTLPVEHGRWSLEWNGTCLRLTPADRLLPSGLEFALAADDLLVLASDGCIEPIADPRGRSLHRALSPGGTH